MLFFYRFFRISLLLLVVLFTPDIPISNPSFESGSFDIARVNGQEKKNFSDENGNHVFCKQYDNYLWLRFAASPEKDGETSEHLDIDIWNYTGAGTYHPADSKSNKRKGKRWNIWWHKGQEVYVNQADSEACNLIIEKKDDQLIGRFSCENLKLNNGTTLLDIENGRFKVTPVSGK